MEFFTNFLTLRGEYYALVLVACAELVAAGTEKRTRASAWILTIFLKRYGDTPMRTPLQSAWSQS